MARNPIADALDFLRGRKGIVVEKGEIMSILPHRGRMLLLDKVVITDEKVIGQFLVTEDVCEGHAVAGGKLVFRGVEMEEMAAQLLGVFWGVKHPNLREKKVGWLRHLGEAKFYGPVFLGDSLEVEIETTRIRERVLGGPEPESIIIAVTGKNFLVRVGKGKKATIEFVKLAIVNLESLA